MQKIIILGICLFVLSLESRADTLANCTYEETIGDWKFLEGPRGLDKTLNCSTFTKYESIYKVKLLFPDVAIDENGEKGYWTLIYNQGFEVVINGRKYFGFSAFKQDGDKVLSYCNHTLGSSSHSIGVDPIDWSCFVGIKENQKNTKPKSSLMNLNLKNDQLLYTHNENLIEKLNNHQSSWKATHYPFLANKSIGDIIRMAGGKKSQNFKNPKTSRPTKMALHEASLLPKSFDWRDINGTNYVSPIRNQGSCGSCYAFASMALAEARVRVQTNNKKKPVFSTQDIVECSSYSQGCEGGFPYLIAGKYAEDYGLVEESCNTYKGVDGQCHTDKTCSRHYTTNYKYIGGFYGACNEVLMRIALVKNGPLAVSFQVYDDLMNYKSGIYHHTSIRDEVNFKFNPWEVTNHVVLIVGYGTSEKGEDYWIVKNSWGTSWGENGFFKILRGTDECSIESIAVEVDAVIRK